MTSYKRIAIVYLVLFGAMVVWALSFLVTKEVVRTVPVFALLFMRFALATALLGAVGMFGERLRVARRELPVLAGLSLLSPIGYFLFETFGVSRTQPSHAAVIIAAIPAAVFLIAALRGQERPTLRRGLGVAIAYGGVVLVIMAGRSEVGASLSGDLLVLGAVLCAALRTALVVDVLKRITPLQLTFYQFLFSLFLFGPLAATDGFAWLSQATVGVVSGVLFLGVFCSAGAYIAMHYALVHLSATQVAVSANSIPLITLFAEFLLLGTALSSLKLVGTLVTIAGVILTQLDRRQMGAFVEGIEEG